MDAGEARQRHHSLGGKDVVSIPKNPSIIMVTPGQEHPGYGATLRLPLSSLCLIAWLRSKDLPAEEIGLWDMRTDPIPPHDLAAVRVAGIGAMTGQQVKYGLKAAERIRKEAPAAVIIWGGIHASLLPEQTAAHPLVDMVVVGEGEETFAAIVERVMEGKPLEVLPGTCLVDEHKGVHRGGARPFIDPDTLPMPAYDVVDLDRYYNIRRQFDYQSSRGCPFRCDFCYNTVFCGRKWRGKSAEKVAAELTAIRDRFGAEMVAFVDDELFIDARRVERLLDLMTAKGGGLRYSASCRLDLVRRFSGKLLRKLRESGFRHLYFGAESGSDEVLAAIHKGITTEDILEGTRQVAKAGIKPVLSFMSGFPGETRGQFGETVALIRRLWKADRRITVNGVFPFSPYPGTLLFDEARKQGLLPPGDLDQWGDWLFQYTPTNPWLPRSRRSAMQTVFLMVRFRYYLDMYRERKGRSPSLIAVWLLTAPLRWSASLRMRLRLFRFAPEWRLFGYAARKTMGYL